MSKLRWTKEKPSQPGLYLVKDDEKDNLPQLIFVFRRIYEDKLRFITFGTDQNTLMENQQDFLWFGPLDAEILKLAGGKEITT